MRVACVQRILRRLDDMPRSIVVRLADAEEDDAVALSLERFRPRKRLERGLRAQARHA